ncbi:hypothetical protein [Streptomyces sp. AP-93]|uniref:hypothetical protein n=1 Tax=Streptomyces sp. AP-93 TaxID=2929048 RepID=UPI001FAFC702|nr:hypothetical protein [Streptomyces sp. AP-93]MCJ0875570.1 hypothetical protein [Streptomyces sp. AP-93]
MDYNPFAVNPITEQRPPDPPAWTAFDDHLLYTVRVVHDLMQGRLPERRPVPSAARLAPWELSLAMGPASASPWPISRKASRVS